MKTVYKYSLTVCDTLQPLDIPALASFRAAAMQNGQLCLWVEINPRADRQKRWFRIFGTGHQIPDDYIWCGTVFEGPFVWHIYEEYRK